MITIFETMAQLVMQQMASFIEIALLIYEKILNFDITKIDYATDVVISAGVSLTGLFFAMEVFSQMAQFRVERIEDAIRVSMKFVIAKVIIENTDVIVGGIYDIFYKTVSNDALNDALIDISAYYKSGGVMEEMTEGGLFGFNYLIVLMPTSIIQITLVVTLIQIGIVIAGIIFEIAIHQFVAPIALSTLCNDTTRSTGIAWMKSFSATCLQIAVIGVLFTVYKELETYFAYESIVVTPTSTIKGMDASALNFINGNLALIAPALLLIMLSIAVKKSGDITKRMLGC